MKMPLCRKFPVPLLAAGLCCLTLVGNVFAYRVILVMIVLDGNKAALYRPLYEQEGPIRRPDDIWESLKRLEFPQRSIAADADNPLRATLKGKIRIVAGYAGEADVASLILVRDRKESGWKIDPKEVERTLKIRKVDTRLKAIWR
jgi:hypothetical protein